MQYLDFASFISLHPSSWMFQNVQGSPVPADCRPCRPVGNCEPNSRWQRTDLTYHPVFKWTNQDWQLTYGVRQLAHKKMKSFFKKKTCNMGGLHDCLYNAWDNHRIHNTTKSIVVKKTYCMLLLMQATLSHAPNHPMVDPAWLERWI